MTEWIERLRGWMEPKRDYWPRPSVFFFSASVAALLTAAAIYAGGMNGAVGFALLGAVMVVTGLHRRRH